MPYKDPAVRKAKHREYSATHYEKNRVEVQATSKKTRKQKRQEWLEFKAAQACTHCGFSHPAAIDFHHIGPKKYSVNELITGGRFKLAYEEIKQCITLCANCHRIHHYDEHERKKGPKPPLEPNTA
jgi:NADPH-dependent glutamate synthase beta subunit-like oxidoreductase